MFSPSSTFGDIHGSLLGVFLGGIFVPGRPRALPVGLIGTVSNTRHVLVLLSGGLDSSACVEFFRHRATHTRALFVDYGQQSAHREGIAANAVASFFQIPITVAKHSPQIAKRKSGLILGRNAFLIFCALLNANIEVGMISIGIHSGTNYWDCSPQFVSFAQAILDGYTNGRVKLSAPFLDWTKKEIWNFCKANSVPIELTYSCELGRIPPCGQCESCADRERLLAS